MRQYMKLMVNVMQVQEEFKLKARMLRPIMELLLKD